MEDVIIIGAGPCGLSAAIECQRAGLSTLIIEKHNVVNSIYLYPDHMQFFSTAELLEIGDIPFPSVNDKPFRHEALAYYRKVSKHYQLAIASYEEATEIARLEDNTFQVTTTTRSGDTKRYQAHHVILSTGYFDHPNLIGIPGEELDNVTHYFRDSHPYTGMNVVIIGGSNSSVDAAMELLRVDAKVTIVYRGNQISDRIKPWVKPLFESMIDKERITMRLQSKVTEIHPDHVVIQSEKDGSIEILPNDFVLALTGFRPDRQLLSSTGIKMAEDGDKPVFNPDTMESNVPGLYVAGVVASGSNANEIFIESGRHHGGLIAANIIRERNRKGTQS